MNLENPPLTPRARELIHNAGKLAQRYNHGCVGSEHILVAVLQFEHGCCPEVRKRLRLPKTIGERALRALDSIFEDYE